MLTNQERNESLLDAFFEGVGEDRSRWNDLTFVVQRAYFLADAAVAGKLESFCQSWQAFDFEEGLPLQKYFDSIRVGASRRGLTVDEVRKC